jgi:hypothetical protein
MITKVLLYLKLNLNRNIAGPNVLSAITLFVAIGIVLAAYNSSDKILHELGKAVTVFSLLFLIKTLSIKPNNDEEN